jgi:hypothetical protein
MVYAVLSHNRKDNMKWMITTECEKAMRKYHLSYLLHKYNKMVKELEAGYNYSTKDKVLRKMINVGMIEYNRIHSVCYENLRYGGYEERYFTCYYVGQYSFHTPLSPTEEEKCLARRLPPGWISPRVEIEMTAEEKQELLDFIKDIELMDKLEAERQMIVYHAYVEEEEDAGVPYNTYIDIKRGLLTDKKMKPESRAFNEQRIKRYENWIGSEAY